MTMECMIFHNRFSLEKRLGSGAFGQLYQGVDVKTGREVAIKLEPDTAKQPQVLYEGKLYKVFSDCEAVPSLHWCGHEQGYNVLVMDLMGPCLEELFQYCGRRFTLKTVLMLGSQMISCLEYLHSRGFLHRDVKPDNFLIGRGSKQDVVHIIDFGLAKKYRDKHNPDHIPYREGKNMLGTARYASLSAHLGYEQGRRDDLEAMGYVLMYFLRGGLPWQGVQGQDHNARIKSIAACKQLTVETGDLCRGYPLEFSKYFDYCRRLHFEEQPDYDLLRRSFKNCSICEGCDMDTFDWRDVPDAIEPVQPSCSERATCNTRSMQLSQEEEGETREGFDLLQMRPSRRSDIESDFAGNAMSADGSAVERGILEENPPN